MYCCTGMNHHYVHIQTFANKNRDPRPEVQRLTLQMVNFSKRFFLMKQLVECSYIYKLLESS
jgi:hypothetical protein